MSSALILAYVGVVLMVGVSGLASAVGTARCGMASVGALKKNGGAFGSYMILSALPGSQGLYGFSNMLLLSAIVFYLHKYAAHLYSLVTTLKVMVPQPIAPNVHINILFV